MKVTDMEMTPELEKDYNTLLEIYRLFIDKNDVKHYFKKTQREIVMPEGVDPELETMVVCSGHLLTYGLTAFKGNEVAFAVASAKMDIDPAEILLPFMQKHKLTKEQLSEFSLNLFTEHYQWLMENTEDDEEESKHEIPVNDKKYIPALERNAPTDVKNCQYCKGEELRQLHHNPMFEVGVIHSNLYIDVDMGDDLGVRGTIIEINYCPMCGEHLPKNINKMLETANKSLKRFLRKNKNATSSDLVDFAFEADDDTFSGYILALMGGITCRYICDRKDKWCKIKSACAYPKDEIIKKWFDSYLQA